MWRVVQDNQLQAAATERLAQESKRDSEIMKTITVVTLLYLPATFVCVSAEANAWANPVTERGGQTLLSMGLFEFDIGEEGSGRLKVARQGWIFIVIALPLTIITLGLAYVWQRRTEEQAKRETDERKRRAEEAARPAFDAPIAVVAAGITGAAAVLGTPEFVAGASEAKKGGSSNAIVAQSGGARTTDPLSQTERAPRWRSRLALWRRRSRANSSEEMV